MHFLPHFLSVFHIYSSMIHYYETSSIEYTDGDITNGKFILPKESVATSNNVRLFICMYGTLMNFHERFKFRYDNLEIPSEKAHKCVYELDFIRNNIIKDIFVAIVEEDDFWEYVEPYPWHMLMMSELYKFCDGDYVFLLPIYDGVQMDHRLNMIWRCFGNIAKEHTIVANSSCFNIFVHSRNDVLICDSLYLCEEWSKNGGSAFWWPTINDNCDVAGELLSKRIKLLSEAIVELNELKKPKIVLDV